MTAVTFNVPVKWHFQAVLMQGGPCVGIPFPVFRATSPDGLSFIEQLPKFGWIFGTGPAASVKHEGCLPLKTALGAQEFLRYISATLNVQYLNDEPVPAAYSAKFFKEKADAEAVYAPKYAAAHLQPPKSTLELAWASVRYRNGSFVMKGRLQTMVNCNETITPGMKSILRGVPARPPFWAPTPVARIPFDIFPPRKTSFNRWRRAEPSLGASVDCAQQPAGSANHEPDECDFHGANPGRPSCSWQE